jgi:hypothetical protein
MLDDIRERPRATLAGIIDRRQQRDPAWTPPASVRALEWIFLQDSTRRDRIGAMALRLLRARRPASLE